MKKQKFVWVLENEDGENLAVSECVGGLVSYLEDQGMSLVSSLKQGEADYQIESEYSDSILSESFHATKREVFRC